MPFVKFGLDEESYKRLTRMAEEAGISIQDYVRKKVFEQPDTVFTPSEAVKRALASKKAGELFTLPDLYAEEWTLERAEAGVFGKRFFEYIEKHQKSLPIKFAGMTKGNRRAQYQIKKEEQP